jgi:dihydroxy-acid dehydratase
MAKNLRSIFEPGSTRWAVRRAQWIAMGIKEEDFDKPKIAVVNSSSGLSVCYQHLDQVSKALQQACRSRSARWHPPTSSPAPAARAAT